MIKELDVNKPYPSDKEIEQLPVIAEENVAAGDGSLDPLDGRNEAAREHECDACGVIIENADEILRSPDKAWECLTCGAALRLSPIDRTHLPREGKL